MIGAPSNQYAENSQCAPPALWGGIDLNTLRLLRSAFSVDVLYLRCLVNEVTPPAVSSSISNSTRSSLD